MSVQAPPRRPSWLLRRFGPHRDDPAQAYLDGVRAVAILGVVAYHGWGIVGQPRLVVGPLDLTWIADSEGLAAILVLFLLSGFLLAQPWFRARLTGRARPAHGRFLARRVLRILPAYYLSIAVTLAIFLPLGRISRESVTGWLGVRSLGGQALLLQGLYPVSSGNLGAINPVYWTLTVELSFYLVLPAMVWVFLRWRTRWALLCALAITVTWTWLSWNGLGPLVRTMTRTVQDTGPTLAVPTGDLHSRVLLQQSLLGFLFTLALGVGLARLAVAARRPRRPRTVFFAADPVAPPWWLGRGVTRIGFGVGTAVLLGSMYALSALSSTRAAPLSLFIEVTTLSIGLALMMYGVAFGRVGCRVLEWMPLRFFGWISYGVYLFHLPVLHLLHEYTPIGSLTPGEEVGPLFLAALAVTVVVATLSWRFVERPLLESSGRAKPHRRARPVRTALGAIGAAATAMVLVVVVTSPMAATAGTASGVFRGPIDGTELAPQSGPATVSQALAGRQVYPEEARLLQDCAARPGSAVQLFGAGWNASATAFACADAKTAADVVGRLLTWEASVGFGRLEHPRVDGGATFYHKGDPTITDRPATFHVRMSRGRWVVGLAVQADTPDSGRYALKTLLAAVQTPD